MMSPGQTSACSPSEILDEYAFKRIRFRADRLTEAFRLTPEDTEDLAQDMALELVKASSRFDPTRSRRHTFVTRTLNRFYKYTARQLESRARSRENCAKPRPVARHRAPVLNDPGKGELSQKGRVDLSLDLTQVIDRLPARQREICLLLANHTPSEIANQLGMHRATVHREIAQMRSALVAAGFTRHG